MQPAQNQHLFFMVENNATNIDNSILAFEIDDFLNPNRTIFRKISGSFVTCKIDADEAKDVKVALFKPYMNLANPSCQKALYYFIKIFVIDLEYCFQIVPSMQSVFNKKIIATVKEFLKDPNTLKMLSNNAKITNIDGEFSIIKTAVVEKG
jgi:hypothetical protein